MNELDRLAEEAAILEAEDNAPQTLPGQEPAPVIDPAQEWRDLAHFGADLVTAPVPELKGEWTHERIDAFGNALARCAEHYGWTTGGILGHPLAGLAIATWPLAVPVVKLAKARKAVKSRENPEQVIPAPAEQRPAGIEIKLGGT